MLSCLTLALALALPADDPKALVEKAIKAHGGAEVLKKYPAYRATVRGTVTAQGMEMELRGESLSALPDKAKMKGVIVIGGQEIPIVQTISGKRITMSLGGTEVPLPDEQAADALHSIYVHALSRLTPLLGDGYTLKPAEPATIDGKKAVGVVVGHAGRPDVTLHFDADTGRVVQTARTGKAEDGSDAERVTRYADYKAVKGVQVPHRETVTLGGKTTADMTVEKAEPLEALDASEFAVD